MDTLHPWQERLSEYLDGDLAGPERAALETHLESCAACRATLDELRAVVAIAGTLEDRPPERDLWPGIAHRIAADRRGETPVVPITRRRAARRRVSFSLPQLAAAAVTLMVLSGGSVWLSLSDRAPDPTGAAAAGRPRDAATPVRYAADYAVPGYDQAVADLERILDEGRDRLDPATVAVLEENLRIIDRAIEDARRALAQDPRDVYLNNHLAESMKRKLQFLRRAGDIVRAQT